MARQITLASIRSKAQTLSDMTTALSVFSVFEFNRAINDSRAALYDTLTNEFQDDYTVPLILNLTADTDPGASGQFSALLPGTGPNWAPDTVYAAGAVSQAVQVDSQGNITASFNAYVCVTPGTSALTGNGPQGTGAAIADGSAVWNFQPSFLKSVLVQAQFGNSAWVTIDRYNLRELDVDRSNLGWLLNGLWVWMRYQIRGTSKIYAQPSPPPTSVLRLQFIPVQPDLVLDTDLLDGVNGWDELIAYDAAIEALYKQQVPTDQLESKRAQIAERIRAAAPNRDAANPLRVQNVRPEW